MLRFTSLALFVLFSNSIPSAQADSVRLDFDKDKSAIKMTAHRTKWLGLGHEDIVIAVGRWFPNVRFDNAHVESSYAEVVVPTDSLEGLDLLEAAKFPQIKFTSTSVEKSGKSDLIVKGHLDLHGASREISAPVHVEVVGTDTIHLTGKLTLKLSAFGLNPNAGDRKLSDDLQVTFDLFTKSASAVAAK